MKTISVATAYANKYLEQRDKLLLLDGARVINIVIAGNIYIVDTVREREYLKGNHSLELYIIKVD